MNIEAELKALATEIQEQGFYAEVCLYWMEDGWILDIGNESDLHLLGQTQGVISTKGKTIEETIERAKEIANVYDRSGNVVALPERH